MVPLKSLFVFLMVCVPVSKFYLWPSGLAEAYTFLPPPPTLKASLWPNQCTKNVLLYVW